MMDCIVGLVSCIDIVIKVRLMRQAIACLFLWCIMRDADQLINDLINMNADTWNSVLASELGVSVDVLRMSVSKKEMLVRSEDRFHMNIIKSKYKSGNLGDTIDPCDDNDLTQSKLSKYVIRLRSGDGTPDCGFGNNVIEAFSCTGKIIVGMDFTESDLSNSYFCDCIFYNCDFASCNLESAVFNTCIVNSCMFHRSNMIGVTIIRSTMIDTAFSETDFTTSNWFDSAVIGSHALHSTFYEARLTGTAIIDSVFNYSIFRGAGFILVSFTMSEFRDCDFGDVGVFDSMFADVDLVGSIFSNSFMTCITSTKLRTDSRSVVELFDSCTNSQIENELFGGSDNIGPDADGLEDTHA